MLTSSSDAESLCNLTLNVWGNAIYERLDGKTNKCTRPRGVFVSFNDALANLYQDSATQEKVDNIEKNQSSVKDIVKRLQYPPEGLDKCFNTVSDYTTHIRY